MTVINELTVKDLSINNPIRTICIQNLAMISVTGEQNTYVTRRKWVNYVVFVPWLSVKCPRREQRSGPQSLTNHQSFFAETCPNYSSCTANSFFNGLAVSLKSKMKIVYQYCCAKSVVLYVNILYFFLKWNICHINFICIKKEMS